MSEKTFDSAFLMVIFLAALTAFGPFVQIFTYRRCPLKPKILTPLPL